MFPRMPSLGVLKAQPPFRLGATFLLSLLPIPKEWQDRRQKIAAATLSRTRIMMEISKTVFN